VTPDEAAKSIIEWTDKLDMSKSGEYWAPRGPSKSIYPHGLAPRMSLSREVEYRRHLVMFSDCFLCIGDIGTADVTMGENLPTPLKLPW
jgi:hypothetical protein